jgi:DNA-directed RNA polymerase III subunit RPC3
LGKRAALVISTLISYGRLDIRKLSNKAGISSVLAKKALVSLIQLGCVSVWEEKNLKTEITYYSFREDGALLLLYSGEIISYIEQLYNNDTLVQIVQNFLALGNLSINEYLTSFGTKDAEETALIEKQFLTLVQDKFFVPIQKTHFAPLKEIWMQTYKIAYNKIPKTSSLSELKRSSEAKSNAKLEFLNILNHEPESLYIKDKMTSFLKVNPNLQLAFDLKRFLKAKRSIQLTQFCSHRVGRITSIVYKQALLNTEKGSPDVVNPLIQIGLTNEEIATLKDYNPKSTAMFSAKDILKTFPKDISLAESILSGPPKRKSNDQRNGSNAKRIKREDGSFQPLDNVYELEEEDEDDDEDEGFDSVSSLAIIDKHLRILVASNVPFLKKASDGLYYVPFPELVVHLKRSVCDSIVSGTLGPPSARILRCVRENRLVSEKLINSVALLKEKEARALTLTLVKFNLLQITEIPKSADRAASKTVFLYRANEQHSNDFVKKNLCWNMGQLLDKIKDLKESNALLITKINRDDVKGKELDYLLPSELVQLKQMKDKELELSIRFNRLASLWEVFQFYF